jgi:cell division protein FtsW
MKITNRNAKNPDLLLLLATLLLVTIGTVMIYSASSFLAMEEFKNGQHFLKKQIFFLVLGLAGMALTTRIYYSNLRKLAWPAIILSAVLLVMLRIPHLGVKAGGAVRWLNLGVFAFQVSELVKITMIIFLSAYLSDNISKVTDFKKGILAPLAITGAMIVLILLQPDFGTSAILAAIALIMIYLAGGRIAHLGAIFAVIIPVAIVILYNQKYRIARIMTFLDPWKDPQGKGFQIIQSMISFGAGGFFGVGIGDSMQKLFYLPEPHTDFILSVIAEESGFLGVSAILLLYIIIILRGFKIALNAPDLFGNLLASGLTMLLALEAFINIAGVMGIIPLKGLPLPLLSYGGSSLTMSLALVGILLNISSNQD